MHDIVGMVGLGVLMMGTFSAQATTPSPDELSLAHRFADTVLVAEPEHLFSFIYHDKSSPELLPSWTHERSECRLDNQRKQYVHAWSDPDTGLQVRLIGVEYLDFPTIEWVVSIRNAGPADAPLLRDIRALDAQIVRRTDGEFVLHHQVGTLVKANDYAPLESSLTPGETLALAPRGGRPCAGVFPYFNLAYDNGGVILVVGWPGQWSATFSRDDGKGLRIRAGQELTHLVLHPGEEIRTPLMVMQFWQGGDRVRSQNIWRRWMLAHSVPRPGGLLPKPQLTPCSSHQYGEMVNADEASQIMFIDRYVEERLPIDYWWMDAGWYVNETGWPNTGTWEVDTKRFPRGLRYITDHAHAKGLKAIVWFEPERVTPGTWLYVHHPEWLLGKGDGQKLLDLGHPEARNWLITHIGDLIESQGIDLYRQDFNIDPLDYWRSHDAPDRMGITENRYVAGYLAYWDALRERFPSLLIDSCASGGHRNDLETLRRSVPLLRSDYIFEPTGQQGHTYGLAPWFPYYGTGVRHTDAYGFRSVMCPGMIPCWDLRDRNLPYDELRRLTSQWDALAPNFFGDFYPLTPYSLDAHDWMAWQFDRPDVGEGMVQAFRREGSPYEVARFNLCGLEESATYIVTNQDLPEEPYEVSGGALMKQGLKIALETQPSAALISYKRKT